VSKIINGS